MTQDRAQLGVFAVIVVAALALVVLTITLLLGMSVVGGIADGIAGEPGNRTATAPFLNASGDLKPGLYDDNDGLLTGDRYVSFQQTGPLTGVVTDVWAVRDSTGRAVRFRGDGGFQSRDEVTIATDDTWTVAAWGAFNETYNTTNGTLLNVDNRILIQYNHSSGTWVGWYYDEDTRDSYRVEAPAQAQPRTLAHITLRHDGTELAIYRNNTLGESVTTDGGTADALSTADWAGRIDEVRGFDTALNNSQRQQLVDSPIRGVPSSDQTLRLMMDTVGDSEPAYFAGTSVSLSGSTRVTGLPGNVLTEGDDYALQVAQGNISPTADGRLYGSPTAFVTYYFEPMRGLTGIGDAFRLLSTSTLLIPAVAVLALLVGGVVVAVRLAGGQDSSRRRTRRGGR